MREAGIPKREGKMDVPDHKRSFISSPFLPHGRGQRKKSTHRIPSLSQLVKIARLPHEPYVLKREGKERPKPIASASTKSEANDRSDRQTVKTHSEPH